MRSRERGSVWALGWQMACRPPERDARERRCRGGAGRGKSGAGASLRDSRPAPRPAPLQGADRGQLPVQHSKHFCRSCRCAARDGRQATYPFTEKPTASGSIARRRVGELETDGKCMSNKMLCSARGAERGDAGKFGFLGDSPNANGRLTGSASSLDGRWIAARSRFSPTARPGLQSPPPGALAIADVEYRPYIHFLPEPPTPQPRNSKTPVACCAHNKTGGATPPLTPVHAALSRPPSQPPLHCPTQREPSRC